VKFYLGTHMPHWLELVDVPLFISRRRLAGRKTFPRARSSWALDSGGFTELNRYGRWSTSPGSYASDVARYSEEIGGLEWAAPMDWMCEPWVVAKTGLTVAEHQRRTVDNYLTLRTIAPELPFIPVLQGWRMEDYLRCADLYDTAGIDLGSQPLIGLGSVCRRQSTGEIGGIVATLAGYGLSLHGFGVKTTGLRSYSMYLTSADSMSWSRRGRQVHPCGHGRAKSEANCLVFAQQWRQHVLTLPEYTQTDLFAMGGRPS
jgi:hypothetical protein